METEDIRSPGATGSLPNVDAGTQTQVLCRSSQRSLLLSHAFCPSLVFLILDILDIKLSCWFWGFVFSFFVFFFFFPLVVLVFWFVFSTTEILLVEDQYNISVLNMCCHILC